MIHTLINLTIMIVLMILLDFFVEEKFHIRKKIVKKIGNIVTIILLIPILIGIDYIFLNIWPELEGYQLYMLSKIAFMMYFLPRKGDKKWEISKS